MLQVKNQVELHRVQQLIKKHLICIIKNSLVNGI